MLRIQISLHRYLDIRLFLDLKDLELNELKDIDLLDLKDLELLNLSILRAKDLKDFLELHNLKHILEHSKNPKKKIREDKR
jgi:hypothetical protein